MKKRDKLPSQIEESERRNKAKIEVD